MAYENVGDVTTRMGISPFSARQHVGVYRSFLVNAFIAEKGKGRAFLRIDDTNPTHTADVDDLIDDLTKVVTADVIAEPPDDFLGVREVGRPGVRAIIESDRLPVYLEHAERLGDLGYLTNHDGAKYFNVTKYISEYGEEIDVPYCGNQARRVVISKVIEKLEFPVVVGSHRALWHLSSVVDDHLLKVSDVVRAHDKIDNQVPQAMLNLILGFKNPTYLYTKTMVGYDKGELPMTTDDVVAAGISLDALRSYLYGTITGRSDLTYHTFSEALKDFDKKSIRPGQIKFDIAKLMSVQRKLHVGKTT